MCSCSGFCGAWYCYWTVPDGFAYDIPIKRSLAEITLSLPPLSPPSMFCPHLSFRAAKIFFINMGTLATQSTSSRRQTVYLTKTNTLTFYKNTNTWCLCLLTSLDETLSEQLKLQKPTGTLHLLLQRPYPTSRALLRLSRGFYNPTISV